MNIYIILLASPFISYMIASLFRFDRRKAVVTTTTILLTLFVGLRNINVGADTFRYAIEYEQVSQYSFRVMLNYAITHKSALFVLLSWLLGIIHVSTNAFFTIIAVVHFITFAIVVYKHSSNISLSYFIYVCLFLTLQLSGIRNTLAAAMLYICFDAAIEKKPRKFIIALIFAILFHRTTMIFVIAYPILNTKRINVSYMWFLIFFPIVYIFRSQVSQIFKYIGGYDNYGSSSLQPGSFMILCIGIVTFGAMMNRGNDENYRKTYKLCIVATLLMPLILVNPSAMRIVKYFLIATTLLLPKAFEKLAKMQSSRNIVVTCFILLLGYQFMGTISGSYVYQYSFFWE